MLRNQVVSTPREFIAAVQNKFGMLSFDLAATPDDSVVLGAYWTPEEDSLSDACPWNTLGRTWLNPPFRNVRPWVKKASETDKTDGPLVLLPAAVCTDWFNTYVRPFAAVHELFPRVFPNVRDCILCDYRRRPGRYLWRWK